MLTNYYLVNWVTLENTTPPINIPRNKWYWWKFEENRINSIESCLLERNSLRSFVFDILRREGIDSQIYNNPKCFKNFMNDKESNRLNWGEGVYINNNNKNPEKTINIIIPKKILISKAVIHTQSYASRAPWFEK